MPKETVAQRIPVDRDDLNKQTFIGYDQDKNEFVSHVTDEAWAQAKAYFNENPGESKLYCYEYGQLSPDLTHTFVQVGYPGNSCVKAISNMTGYPLSRTDSSEPEAVAISDEEWKLAEGTLKDKKRGTKLRHREKFYNSSLRNSFLKVGGAIYAMAGPRWHILSAYAKLVPGVDEHGQFVMIKLPYKFSLRDSNSMCAWASQNECEFSSRARFSIFAGAKTDKADAQQIIISELFQTDLYGWVKSIHNKCASVTVNEVHNLLFLMYLLVAQLSELHDKNILHNDVKPNNIFVTSLTGKWEDIRLAWGDFGHAGDASDQSGVMEDKGGYSGVRGTPLYADPATFPPFSCAPIFEPRYSTKTDGYSVGKIFEQCVDPVLSYLDQVDGIEQTSRDAISVMKSLKELLMLKSTNLRLELSAVAVMLQYVLTQFKPLTDEQKEVIRTCRPKSVPVLSLDSQRVVAQLFEVVVAKQAAMSSFSLDFNILPILAEMEKANSHAAKIIRLKISQACTDPDSNLDAVVSIVKLYFYQFDALTNKEDSIVKIESDDDAVKFWGRCEVIVHFGQTILAQPTDGEAYWANVDSLVFPLLSDILQVYNTADVSESQGLSGSLGVDSADASDCYSPLRGGGIFAQSQSADAGVETTHCKLQEKIQNHFYKMSDGLNNHQQFSLEAIEELHKETFKLPTATPGKNRSCCALM